MPDCYAPIKKLKAQQDRPRIVISIVITGPARVLRNPPVKGRVLFTLFNTFCLTQTDSIISQRDVVVQAHELSAFLPEHFLNEIVLIVIPGGEIIQQQSTGITGVRVKAPEGVV